MRYVQLAATLWVAMALAACKPAQDTATSPVPSRIPAPAIPHAPSAPVAPPDPEPQPTAPPDPAAQQTLIFMGPMDLTIRLSTDDNFATAVMTDNSEHTLSMRRVRSSNGIRLEDGDGVAIEFKNGLGTVEFSQDNVIDIEQYRLP